MPDRSDSHRSAEELLREVLTLRRWLRALVYPGVGLLIPLDHFLLGLSWVEAIGSHIGGYVIAVLAVEIAISYVIKLRKREVYPSMLAVELGSARDLRQACQRSVETLTKWLGAEAALLAFLHKNERGVEVLAAHGFPPGAIRFDSASATYLQAFRDAIRHERTISEPLKDGHPLRPAFGPERRMVHVPVVSMDRAVGVIAFVGHKSVSDLKDHTLLTAIGRVMGLTLDNVRLYNHEYQTLLHILCSALDLRDRVTQGHSRRVADISLTVARQMGVDGEELLDIERGAILHDMGKITLPDAILSKPGPLTPEEWEEMRRHPEVGYRMVKDVPFLHRAAEIVYAHHERCDGAGYPRGLKGEEIPLGSRIFAVVDAYDAMTSDRPYRGARPHEEALAEIQRHTGTQFDPEVVEAFLRAEQGGLITEASICPAPQKSVHEAAVSTLPPAM